MHKTIIYYTDAVLDPVIADYCRRRLKAISLEKGIPIISVSKDNLNFGNMSIKVDRLDRSHSEMFYQIHVGLLAARKYFCAQQIFLCEHDVIYDPSHFDFEVPCVTAEPVFYYNCHKYYYDGRAFYRCEHPNLSGLTCHLDPLLSHLFLRLYRSFELKQSKGGFCTSEPGGKDDYTGIRGLYYSRRPLIDIRHDNNLSRMDFSQESSITAIQDSYDVATLRKELPWPKSV